jgi:hypothetical protein
MWRDDPSGSSRKWLVCPVGQTARNISKVRIIEGIKPTVELTVYPFKAEARLNNI